MAIKTDLPRPEVMESTASIDTSWRKLALEVGSNSQLVFSSKILSAKGITMANSVNILVQSKVGQPP